MRKPQMHLLHLVLEVLLCLRFLRMRLWGLLCLLLPLFRRGYAGWVKGLCTGLR